MTNLPGENVLISEEEVAAPPGYGQHVLDKLYDDVVFGGFQTPENVSGANSPYYQPSALASSEDLSAITATAAANPSPEAVTAALASRLQRVTEARSRRNSVVSLESERPTAEALSRQLSNEDMPSPTSAEHDEVALETLNKVPSYATALRTPARPRSVYGGALVLPTYEDVEAGPDDRPASARHSSSSSASSLDRSPRSRPMSGVPEALAGRLASHGFLDGQFASGPSYLVDRDVRCV